MYIVRASKHCGQGAGALSQQDTGRIIRSQLQSDRAEIRRLRGTLRLRAHSSLACRQYRHGLQQQMQLRRCLAGLT